MPAKLDPQSVLSVHEPSGAVLAVSGAQNVAPLVSVDARQVCARVHGAWVASGTDGLNGLQCGAQVLYPAGWLLA